MEELCTGCLCSGRNLYYIGETGFYNIYIQILNEIPVYDVSQICIRICWECRATLHRFHVFKQRAKHCYNELLEYVYQSPKKLLPISPPRLQVPPISTTSYPEIKSESDILTDQDLDDKAGFLANQSFTDKAETIEIKHEVEEHSEETFAHDLDNEEINHHVELEDKVKEKVKIIKPKRKKKVKKKRAPSIESVKDASDIDNVEFEVQAIDKVEDKKEDLEKEEIDVKCGNCNVSFESVKKLVTHMETAHVPKSKVNGEVNKPRSKSKEILSDKPVCGECGKMFSSRKTYRYHLNVLHKGQNRHPCPRCGKVYQWKSNLGRHMRSHKARDTGELYCSLCDKRFASVATYRQHLRVSRRHVTESDFSFMCNECGKKFVNKTRLRDHIDWDHLKKIKFKCQLCNKAFKTHTSIYVHMKNVHETKDQKDNLCHVCGKSYQNAAKLRYHIVAMHTSETPYQCEQCNAAFGWYSSLYRHVREVHYKMKLQPNRKTKKTKKPDVLPPLVATQHLPLPPLHPQSSTTL